LKTLSALFAALGVLCVIFNADAQKLTVSERRGKAIYLRGSSPSGQEITATIGELDVPASTVNCAGCHGPHGEGKSEGGVTAGNLTWSNLVKPYGHTHPSGRRHGPFNESSITRAVVNGLDPDGNDLLVAMPRYKLSAADMADLIAYLKRLDSDLDPGLTDNKITVGLLLPSQGALADVGAAVKDVFTSYFEDLNSRGGIFNRKIELRFADVATAGSFARDEQIFAFVGGLSAGADDQLASLAREEEIPFIGPATLLPHTENPVNRYVFYLLPGVVEQAVSLVNFAAAQPELKFAIVYDENSLSSAAANAAAAKIGRNLVAKQIYARNIVNDLKSKGATAVFFFGSGSEQSAFLSEAVATGWSPQVFCLGVLSGRDLSSEFKNKIVIAVPTVPSDVSSAGMTEFHALHEKYKFPPRHTATQLSAFAAAKIFVEGLTRAGKDLTREKLIIALEGLYDYDTGATPHITFGPNRRIGAAGAYIVTFDPVTKEFSAASEWVKAY
jgi:ABC-type branched-subunit amino acid transport system substrate-binding protein